MALTIKGKGMVSSTDFKTITFTGKTKSGKSVQIKLFDAINMDNIDWSMVEKDDTVAALKFTATYSNTNHMVSTDGDYEEPWEVKYTGANSDPKADSILLGAGVVSVNSTDIALTRGGSQFLVEREYREINADGDRGPVKDRIVMDSARASLKVNALTFLTNMSEVYAGITVTT